MKPIMDLRTTILEEPDNTAVILERFISENTFPLIDADVATFFFVDDADIEEVDLITWVFGMESRQPLQRLLPDVSAWFLPVQLPHAGRVEYKYEVRSGDGRGWVRDPLNPLQAFDPFGSNSVCPMPGYAEPPWVQPYPHVRKGRLEAFEFSSEVYGAKRQIAVYLPNEYRPYKRYPVIVCHDGSDYLKFAGIKTVLDNLITRHELLPVIVAFTNGHARNEEYGADPRQPKFLVEEVLPELDRRYPIREEPRYRGLMGASFGGVSTLFTAWTYPGVFGQLLLQSGSFVFTDVGTHDRGPLWDPVVQFINAFRKDPQRIAANVFMSCGTFESLIYYNRSLVPLLRQQGLQVRFVEASDGHNWIAWRDRLRDGLTWLFPGHLWMYYD